jgi:hypothetical protein
MSEVLVRGADEQTHVHPDPIAVTLAASEMVGSQVPRWWTLHPRLMASNHVGCAGQGGGRSEICFILNSSSLPSLEEKFASISPGSTHNEQKIYTIYKDISL